MAALSRRAMNEAKAGEAAVAGSSETAARPLSRGSESEPRGSWELPVGSASWLHAKHQELQQGVQGTAVGQMGVQILEMFEARRLRQQRRPWVI